MKINVGCCPNEKLFQLVGLKCGVREELVDKKVLQDKTGQRRK